jgi:hypothetical protein
VEFWVSWIDYLTSWAAHICINKTIKLYFCSRRSASLNLLSRTLYFHPCGVWRAELCALLSIRERLLKH